MTLQLAIHGAAGRMGQAVVRLTLGDPDVKLVGALERAGSSTLGSRLGDISITSSLPEALAHADVVVDFSTVNALAPLLEYCVQHGLAAVIGTTGLSVREREAIDALAELAPVLVAPNMSVGVALFLDLAARAARSLGSDFDAEIFEMHHRTKIDAPSGTATRLGEVIAAAKSLDPTRAMALRATSRGPRAEHEVGVASLRGGDVVGDHTVFFAGPGERIELTHRALDRDIFARGALRAAKWLAGRDPGLYSMQDVVQST